MLVVVQSLCHVIFFAACQASASFTISWSLLKLMSIEPMVPSKHLLLCRTLSGFVFLQMNYQQQISITEHSYELLYYWSIYISFFLYIFSQTFFIHQSIYLTNISYLLCVQHISKWGLENLDVYYLQIYGEIKLAVKKQSKI